MCSAGLEPATLLVRSRHTRCSTNWATNAKGKVAWKGNGYIVGIRNITTHPLRWRAVCTFPLHVDILIVLLMTIWVTNYERCNYYGMNKVDKIPWLNWIVVKSRDTGTLDSYLKKTYKKKTVILQCLYILFFKKFLHRVFWVFLCPEKAREKYIRQILPVSSVHHFSRIWTTRNQHGYGYPRP